MFVSVLALTFNFVKKDVHFWISFSALMMIENDLKFLVHFNSLRIVQLNMLSSFAPNSGCFKASFTYRSEKFNKSNIVQYRL